MAPDGLSPPAGDDAPAEDLMSDAGEVLLVFHSQFKENSLK